ncbi:ABC transporter permease [Archangium sp. Cb G35]|uniref:ABC transporter permease n=1 Tax=Archangium sp. Cb G35 TaxID=1920190 RepID=UPI0009F98BFE|nr:ABC transporter permease [Archangium sp. Cb G35]
MRYPGFKRLLKLAVRPRAVEQDVDEELRFHLEMRAAAHEREGLSPAEARAAAEREFGDVAGVREECVRIGHERERMMKRFLLWDALAQDVRYAVRMLRHAPGFALVAVLTLALGIGATTAIFSVVRGVLLRPLPFAEPERLVRMWQANPSQGVARGDVSPLDFADWKARQRSFEDMGTWWYVEGMSGSNLSGDGEPQRLPAAYVNDGFFSTLGVAPVLGRALLAGEHQPGHNAVVVLSHGLWQRRFGGDRAILGRTLTLDGLPITVVGVMPPGFSFPSERVDLWLSDSLIDESGIPRQRQVRWQSVVARLKPGVSLETARSEMNGVARQLAEEYPATNLQTSAVTAVPLHEAVTGDVRSGLMVLLGAVGFLLLIACVNVANLMLTRATARERELAVRAALGAGPGRLMGQLLTESLVLATLGGAAGLLLAAWGTELLLAFSVKQLPRLHEVRVDGAVLAFAMGATLFTGVLFGLLPAVRAGSPRLAPVLKAAGRGMTGTGGARLRGALVVTEVALAVVLMAGAGLAVRSLMSLLSVEPGFRAEGAVVVSFSSSPAGRPSRQYLAEVLERVREVPGVQVAGTTKNLPLEGSGEPAPLILPGQSQESAADAPRVHYLYVSNDYFRAMGIPLLRGRAFTSQDTSEMPVVMMVNDAFARRFFPGEDVLGRSIQWGQVAAPIVGVVGDVRQESLSEPAPPLVYVHVLQQSRSSVNLVVRGQGAPLQLAAAVRQAIWSVNPNQTITRITTLEEVVGGSVARPRLIAALLGLFAVLALVLGAVGIYGVLAYTVGQRQREIGVRLALGARPAEVLGMILRGGMRLAGLGVALGVAGALVLSRVMSSILYGVAPHDPLTFVAVAVVLLGVALVACLVPARRAMRVDPAVSLRAE